MQSIRLHAGRERESRTLMADVVATEGFPPGLKSMRD